MKKLTKQEAESRIFCLYFYAYVTSDHEEVLMLDNKNKTAKWTPIGDIGFHNWIELPETYLKLFDKYGKSMTRDGMKLCKITVQTLGSFFAKEDFLKQEKLVKNIRKKIKNLIAEGFDDENEIFTTI